MVHLSYIVLSCATVPTCLALALAWPSRAHLCREPFRCGTVAVLGYSAAVGYAVALAASNWLANSSTKLLGKHSSGSIHPLSWLFMLPYHLGLRVKLGIQRLMSTEPLFNRVLPGWYIGGWPWHGLELPSDGPSVLDCTCELPRTHRNRYFCLPVWDTQAPPASQIERGVAFALTERALGKSVYVHCAHGHGRSALLLIACLLEAGQVGSPEEGLALLKAARPRVHLNRRQRLALEAWVRGRQGARAGGLQMQALSAAAAAAAAATAATAMATGGMAGLSSASLQRRVSAGGASDGGGGGCGGGGGDADGAARVHLLADSRDSAATLLPPTPASPAVGPHHSGVVMAASYSLESRLHGAGSHPLGEVVRSAGSHVAAAAAAAAAVAAAASLEGGKKLS